MYGTGTPQRSNLHTVLERFSVAAPIRGGILCSESTTVERWEEIQRPKRTWKPNSNASSDGAWRQSSTIGYAQVAMQSCLANRGTLNLFRTTLPQGETSRNLERCWSYRPCWTLSAALAPTCGSRSASGAWGHGVDVSRDDRCRPRAAACICSEAPQTPRFFYRPRLVPSLAGSGLVGLERLAASCLTVRRPKSGLEQCVRTSLPGGDFLGVMSTSGAHG